MASLEGRLGRYSRTREPSLLLEAQAVQEAEALRGMIREAVGDADVVRAVGWFHWFRQGLLGPDRGAADFEVAWPALEFTSRSDPERVPSDFLAALRFTSDQHARLTDDEQGRHLAYLVNNLALLHMRRYDAVSDRRGLVVAAVLLKRLAETGFEGAVRAVYLNNLSNALRYLARTTGNGLLLQESVEALRTSLALTPDGDKDEASRWDNLSTLLPEVLAMTGDQSLAAESIEAGRRGLKLTPADSPDRLQRLSNLCGRLLDEFHRTGTGSRLEESVQLGREAADVANASDAYRAAALNNLGKALLERFAVHGEERDLEEATALFRSTLELMEPLGTHYSAAASNMRKALSLRATRGDASAAAEAVRLAEHDLTATPENHPAYGDRLNGLAEAFRIRYLAIGEPADLEAGAELSRRAAALAGSSPVVRAGYLNEVFITLWDHFLRTNSQQSLWSAITSLSEALGLIPRGHEFAPVFLSNLGSAWYEHYLRTRNLRSLEMAERFCRAAVAASAHERGIGLAGRLSNLSGTLLQLFNLTGDTRALDEAVTTARESVQIAEAVGAVHPAMFNSLSRALLQLVRVSDDADARREVVTMARAALERAAPTDARRAVFSVNLCVALWHDYQISGRDGSLEEIEQVGGKASAQLSAAPIWRLRAAHVAATAGAQLGAWPRAFAHLEYAVDLFPLIASRQLSREDQEDGLIHTLNIASEAGAAALELGRIEDAVGLLEKGRVLIHGLALDSRADLEDLRVSYSDLAGRLDAILREMSELDDR